MQTTLRRAVSAVALALALGACATVDPSNYAATAERVRIETDLYTQNTSYRAPLVLWTNSLFNYGDYRLRATRIDAASLRPEMIQLYVTAHVQGGWPFFDTAHALGGDRIEAVRISSDVSCSGSMFGCLHTEVVGLTLTQEQFNRFAATGLEVQMSGRGGVRSRFTVPAPYFQAFASAFGGSTATPATVAVNK